MRLERTFYAGLTALTVTCGGQNLGLELHKDKPEPSIKCDELEDITFHNPALDPEDLDSKLYPNTRIGSFYPPCTLWVDLEPSKTSEYGFALRNLDPIETNRLLIDAALNGGKLSIDELTDFALSREDSIAQHYCPGDFRRDIKIDVYGQVTLWEYRETGDGYYPVVPQSEVRIRYDLDNGESIGHIWTEDKRSDKEEDHKETETLFHRPVQVDFESWLHCESGRKFTTDEMIEDPMLPFLTPTP